MVAVVGVEEEPESTEEAIQHIAAEPEQKAAEAASAAEEAAIPAPMAIAATVEVGFVPKELQVC